MPLNVKAKTKSGDQHAADVNTLVYHEGKLYSGADDGKIMVWDKDLNKLNEVQGHPTTVYCLAAGNDTLYSCSNDGALLSWELGSLKEKSRLLQIDNEIYRVTFSDGILYSADDQGNVRSHKDNVVKGLYELLEPLRELIVRDQCMYTVRDLDLVITGIKGEKTYEVRAMFHGRAPMCLVGDKLCYSSRSGKDLVIHENTPPYKNVCEVKNAHEMIINALTGTSNGDSLLYSSGWDKILKRWKIENGACVPIDSCDVGEVVNVMTTGDKNVIYAGCGNGSIVRVDG